MTPGSGRTPSTVLMTADAVGGVWSYALGLCAALSDTRFVLATMGPRPSTAQRAAVARLANTTSAESDYRLEWMHGAEAHLAASRDWLGALAERHDADLVHVNGYAHAALAGSRPTLAIAHSDVLSWWTAVHGQAPPAEWDNYRRQVMAGLAAASRVVAPTRSVLGDLERHYGVALPQATVISNGIGPAAFRPLPKRPAVMAAGRAWDTAKNLGLLDSIASDLAWPVEIGGDVAHPEGGAPSFRHVRLLGVLDPGEMARRLGAAAIFAAPARYEPFGLGILEAAAAGCALVLGDIASLRENWDGAAVFVAPDDRAGWRSALALLIADRQERSRLSGLARSRAGHFTIYRTARAYAALYREMINVPAAREVA